MNKDKLPNYYDVSDDDMKIDEKKASEIDMPNKNSVIKEKKEYRNNIKEKFDNKRHHSHSHSNKRDNYHYSTKYHNRTRHREKSKDILKRSRRSRSRSYENKSSYTSSYYSKSSNSIKSKGRRNKDTERNKNRKYSSSYSYSSSSSSYSSINKEKRAKNNSKAIEKKKQINQTAFENEFETNNHSSIPKWSSPFKDQNSIKTLKISNKGKKIEVIMSNQLKPITKEKPNFAPSGLLSKQTNTQNEVVLKYTTPQDAGIPMQNWRLYEFHKESDEPKFIHRLNGMDHFLIGKDTRVSSIILEKMTCSRQHAVIQFRKRIKKDNDERMNEEIIPYVIDLNSTNGTLLNKEKIEPSVYYELKHEDVLNFGDENVDYVVMAL